MPAELLAGTKKSWTDEHNVCNPDWTLGATDKWKKGGKDKPILA